MFKFVVFYEVVCEVIKIVYIYYIVADVSHKNRSKYKSCVRVYEAFLLNAQ
jgi:hypothetical protein